MAYSVPEFLEDIRNEEPGWAFHIGPNFCTPAMAQDVPKFEIGGGIAYRSFDQFSGSRLNMGGGKPTATTIFGASSMWP